MDFNFERNWDFKRIKAFKIKFNLILRILQTNSPWFTDNTVYR